jgi:citrate lyase subunit beta/citryl-CoA lyase
MVSDGNRRPPPLRRSWLALPGADRGELTRAARSGADVLIQELEDFTPPARRGEARALAAATYASWRRVGALAAVRINPLTTEGMTDLAAVVPARPNIIIMAKVAEPAEVAALDRAVGDLERAHGLPPGGIELVPNIESARGVIQIYAIATASPRVTGVAGSTEDMAADLGAVRGKDAQELAYVRQRLHVECVAAGVLPIDCPYTFADAAGCAADARWARRLGYVAKLAVDPAHVAMINAAMTPSAAEAADARAIVAAFEAARAEGRAGARVGDVLVEMPIYLNAKRILQRAAALAGIPSEIG